MGGRGTSSVSLAVFELVLSLVVAGIAHAEHPKVRGIWFTDREMPPSGIFNLPAEFRYGPPTESPIFERSGSPVKP
jgi:hypothetical protein